MGKQRKKKVVRSWDSSDFTNLTKYVAQYKGFASSDFINYKNLETAMSTGLLNSFLYSLRRITNQPPQTLIVTDPVGVFTNAYTLIISVLKSNIQYSGGGVYSPNLSVYTNFGLLSAPAVSSGNYFIFTVRYPEMYDGDFIIDTLFIYDERVIYDEESDSGQIQIAATPYPITFEVSVNSLTFDTPSNLLVDVDYIYTGPNFRKNLFRVETEYDNTTIITTYNSNTSNFNIEFPIIYVEDSISLQFFYRTSFSTSLTNYTNSPPFPQTFDVSYGGGGFVSPYTLVVFADPSLILFNGSPLSSNYYSNLTLFSTQSDVTVSNTINVEFTTSTNAIFVLTFPQAVYQQTNISLDMALATRHTGYSSLTNFNEFPYIVPTNLDESYDPVTFEDRTSSNIKVIFNYSTICGVLPISYYWGFYGEALDKQFVTSNTSSSYSYLITGLSYSTEYAIEIKASNMYGQSNIYVDSFETLPQPPIFDYQTVFPVTSTITGSSAIMDFDTTGITGSEPISYSYAISQNSNTLENWQGVDVPIFTIFTELQSNTTYYHRIRASNLGGTSNTSTQVFTTTSGSPKFNGYLATYEDLSSAYLKIKFDTSYMTGTTPITYKFGICSELTAFDSNANLDETYSITPTNIGGGILESEVSNLLAETLYYYGVRGFNVDGITESGISQITTLIGPPDFRDTNINIIGFSSSFIQLDYLATFPLYVHSPFTVSFGFGTTSENIVYDTQTDFYSSNGFRATKNDVDPYTTYYFNVKIDDPYGSATSKIYYITTLTIPPDLHNSVPTVEDISFGSFRIVFDASSVTGTPSNFTYYAGYSDRGSLPPEINNYPVLMTLSDTVYVANITDLCDYKNYKYGIVAIGVCDQAYSTLQDISTLQRPPEFTGQTFYQNIESAIRNDYQLQINIGIPELTGDLVGTAPFTYTMAASSNSNVTGTFYDISEIGASLITSPLFTDLSDNTTYYFSIKATNSIGYAVYSSNDFSLSTIAGEPMDFTNSFPYPTNKTTTSLSLTFEKGFPGSIPFTLSYGFGIDASALTYYPLTSNDPGMYWADITGLSEETTYFYQIVGHNRYGSQSTIIFDVSTLPPSYLVVDGTNSTFVFRPQSATNFIIQGLGGSDVLLNGIPLPDPSILTFDYLDQSLAAKDIVYDKGAYSITGTFSNALAGGGTKDFLFTASQTDYDTITLSIPPIEFLIITGSGSFTGEFVTPKSAVFSLSIANVTYQGSPLDYEAVTFEDNAYVPSSYSFISNDNITFRFGITYESNMYDISGLDLTLVYSNLYYGPTIFVPTIPVQASVINGLDSNTILQFTSLSAGTLTGQVLIPYTSLCGSVTVTGGSGPLEPIDFWDANSGTSELTARKSGIGEFVQPTLYNPSPQEEYIRYIFTYPSYGGNGSNIDIDFEYNGTKAPQGQNSSVTLTKSDQFLNYPLTISAAFTGMKTFKVKIPVEGIVSYGTIDNPLNFTMNMNDEGETYDIKQNTASYEDPYWTFSFVIAAGSTTNGEGTGTVQEIIEKITYNQFNYYTNGSLPVDVARIIPYAVRAPYMSIPMTASMTSDGSESRLGIAFPLGFNGGMEYIFSKYGVNFNPTTKPLLLNESSFQSSPYDQLIIEFNPDSGIYIQAYTYMNDALGYIIDLATYNTWALSPIFPCRFVFQTPEGITIYINENVGNVANWGA